MCEKRGTISDGMKAKLGQIMVIVPYAVDIRSRGYKTFLVFNSTEYEIDPAHKC